MSTRAFESAERRLAPSQRKLTIRDDSLVILELTGVGGDFAHSTYYVLSRSDADASVARHLKRGAHALIHHREGTVTFTPEASR